MVGVMLVLIVLLAVGLSSLMIAATTRSRSTPVRLLFTYLVAWAQIVLWPLALSPIDALTRRGIVFAALTSLTIAGIAWAAADRPPVVPFRSSLERAAAQLRDPVVAVPTGAVALAYTYLAAVGVALPQGDHDPLVYQLTRAALWRQQHSVGIIGDGIEPRLDGNPVAAELGQVVWLTLAGDERFVWLSQFAATFALALGVFALARRIGIHYRQAVLSAVLVPTFAVVELQSVTALNDVVVASFVVAASVFACGRGAGEWVGLALGVALAIGTKFTGPLLIPLIALLVASAQPPRRWLAAGAALLVGAVLGSGWYVVNQVRVGDPSGGIANAAGQVPDRTVVGVGLRVQQLALDAFDLSGLLGDWRFAYAVAGVVILLWGFGAARSRGASSPVALAGVGIVLIALPILVAAGRAGLHRGFRLTWELAGAEQAIAELSLSSLSRRADGVDSWFGPLFVPLAVAALVVATVDALRGRLPPSGVVLASAPFVGTVVLAVAIVYDPWRGRFLMAAAAMSVATWGVVTRTRWVAVLASAAGTVSVVCCAATWEVKPTGIGYDGGNAQQSIWVASRWEAQTIFRQTTRDEKEEQATIRYVEEKVPADAAIALRVRGNDFRYPAFGADLRRTVQLVGRNGQLPGNAGWAVLAPGVAPLRCERAWVTRRAGVVGWRVLERVALDGVCRDVP